MHVKHDTKNYLFCTYSDKLFLKDNCFDNSWVRH